MTRLSSFLTAVVIPAALGCGGEATPPVAEGAMAADSADQFIVGMETNLHEGGVRRAHIVSDSAVFYDSSQRLLMFGVTADFYTNTGAKEGVLVAKRAMYNRATELMEAFGAVQLVTLDGRRLNTEQMRYDKSRNEVSGDSAFVARQPERTIQGVGFKTDPGMSTLDVARVIRISAGTVTLPQR